MIFRITLGKKNCTTTEYMFLKSLKLKSQLLVWHIWSLIFLHDDHRCNFLFYTIFYRCVHFIFNFSVDFFLYFRYLFSFFLFSVLVFETGMQFPLLIPWTMYAFILIFIPFLNYVPILLILILGNRLVFLFSLVTISIFEPDFFSSAFTLPLSSFRCFSFFRSQSLQLLCLSFSL